MGEPLRHRIAVRDAEFDPEGRRVVTAAAIAKTVHIWDVRSSQQIVAPMLHQEWVHRASFSPDGRSVVTASDKGVISDALTQNVARVWDASRGQPVGAPMPHQNEVKQVSFSPDGQWILTASKDKTARLWDARSGQPLGEPMRHEGWVNAETLVRTGSEW